MTLQQACHPVFASSFCFLAEIMFIVIHLAVTTSKPPDIHFGQPKDSFLHVDNDAHQFIFLGTCEYFRPSKNSTPSPFFAFSR